MNTTMGTCRARAQYSNFDASQWASSRENLSSGVCEQHRRRPACESRSLISAFVILFLESTLCKLATGENFNSLASLCSRGDWFETRLVENPEDRFCRNAAPIIQYSRTSEFRTPKFLNTRLFEINIGHNRFREKDPFMNCF